ncbi:type I restriction enzyme S subunit [Acinetobacter calcoaceticus]|uniref:Type I restriction enzyme S subunit n=1 Tax=Acinetobacter calcoaceticus TaxID=471 RepID=A0A4R1XWF0_ACICA|nr:type I restriction enzyme S subunit [Acinetobacter calcoaceticus]
MSGGKIPTQWMKTDLDNVLLSIMGGGTPSKANSNYYQGDIPWMSVKDMNKNVLEDTIDHISQDAVDNSSTNVIPAGVPIIATRMSLGKIVVANFDTAINQDLKALFLPKNIDRNYLIWWYRSIARDIESLGTGTTVKGVRLEVLRELQFPVAPLAEQQVIADKLDILLAQVESIKARLERIPEIFKQFRQSVLAAAVSGKLTEEWDVQDCLLSDVVEFQNGYAFKSEWFSDAGAYQVIKLGNIRDGRLFIENAPAYVDRKIGQEFERFKPNVGDTLISMTGTRFKQDYGFGCLVETDQDILINQRVGRLIPIREKITPEFLNLFIRSEQFRRQFFQGETGGVNQGNVGSKHIMSLSIKVPRIEIQIEVVNKVIKALNAVTVIERQAELALERVNNLTQSILAKAFRGELTAEWHEANPELISGDNSAEALLGRIKAERELAKPATKRGRGKA